MEHATTTPNNPEAEQDVDEPERAPQAPPEIWACSLSDYNAGILHGAWINAAQEPAELRDAVAAMLEASPTNPNAEEWAIFEYEGFAGIHLDEHETLDTVSRLAAGLIEHGPAFAAWVDHAGRDGAELDRFDEAFLGQWETVQAYAEDILDDLGYIQLVEQAVPANLP
jgi:antirestriction protein